MLKAAAVFSDHMVLQRERPIAVFGWADETVAVSLAGAKIAAEPVDGRFEAFLPPLPAGGPYDLILQSGGEEIAFSDVMIGEVWRCGGQSNMELRLREARDGQKEAESGSDPLLRFYEVPAAARREEAEDRERFTCWKALTPGQCGDVSAVAYFAGRRLRAALGVPVGMLVCCVGGTQISNWISREALTTFPEGQSCLQDFEKEIDGISDEQFERATAVYDARVAAYCAEGEKLRQANPDIRVQEITARLGDYPWPPPSGRWMLRRPGGLWENMAERITPFSARGLMWYQGESDSGIADRYEKLFARMIREWRAAFRNDGLFVAAAQLPGFGADPGLEDWAAIRMAQERVCDKIPGCALACLLDSGEHDNIHPVDKRTPGNRLADLALRGAYGLPINCGMPRLTGAHWADGRAELRFSAPLRPLNSSLRSLLIDGKPAEGAETSGDRLILRADKPCLIAYAQENDPDACLFGLDGTPVFPFSVRAK